MKYRIIERVIKGKITTYYSRFFNFSNMIVCAYVRGHLGGSECVDAGG